MTEIASSSVFGISSSSFYRQFKMDLNECETSSSEKSFNAMANETLRSGNISCFCIVEYLLFTLIVKHYEFVFKIRIA